MITKLSAEQETKLSEYKDKWIKIGLDTSRANRAAAENYCREAYIIAGLEAPKMIFWAESPIGLLLTAKLIKEIAAKGFKPYAGGGTKSVGAQVWAQVRAQVWAQVRDQVGAQVWDQVRDQVGAQVRDQVGAQVWDQVRDQVWAQVRDQVGAQVWDQVRDQVGAQVRDQVGAQVWAQVRDQVRDQVGAQELKTEYNEIFSWGQHDVGWLSWANYFQEVCDLRCCDRLTPLMNLSKETGWQLLYKDIAILSEKPKLLSLNQNGRLHSTKGPAVLWMDTYELFALDGTRINKEIYDLIFNQTDGEKIMAIGNVEHRLVAIKYFGVEKLLSQLKAKILSTHDDYTLFAVTIEGEEEKLLKMKNPSEDKWHYEFVDPKIKTVKQALAWRMGLDTYQEPVAIA